MIFQNLSWEIEKEASNEVHVSSETMISRHKKELLNELWAIKTMKFQVAVSKNIIKAIFDSEAEINILFYLIILKLELMIWSNMIITMRDISNKLLYVIKYISEVSV